MYKSLKELFDAHAGKFKYDRKLAKEISNYIISFITSNEDHVRFFSSTLVGVYPAKFMPRNTNELWHLFEIDRLEVKKDILELGEIDRDHKVASDPTNHLLVYTMHRVRNSKDIPDKLKTITIANLFTILQIKFNTSLINSYYPYPVDRELAITVHQRLSRRHILRQFDTWREIITYRSNNFFNNPKRDGNVKVNRVIDKYNHTQDIVDVITGVQTAVRSSLKEYSAVFDTVYNEDKRMVSVSNMGTTIEGDSTILDKISQVNNYQTYLRKIVISERDLIKDDLLTMLVNNMSGVRYKPVYKVLRYIALNIGGKKQDDIEQFVEDNLTFSLTFIRRNSIDVRDLQTLLRRLQGGLASARSTEPELLHTRALCDKIVERALGKKLYKSTAIAIRTSVMLYLVMRTLTQSHYSNG